MKSNICLGPTPESCVQFDSPQISKGITENKLKNIRETGASIVVTGCRGCRVTIGGNMNEKDHIQVLHPLQLVDKFLSDGAS